MSAVCSSHIDPPWDVEGVRTCGMESFAPSACRILSLHEPFNTIHTIDASSCHSLWRHLFKILCICICMNPISFFFFGYICRLLGPTHPLWFLLQWSCRHTFEEMHLWPVKTLTVRRPGWSVDACSLGLFFFSRPILFFDVPHPPTNCFLLWPRERCCELVFWSGQRIRTQDP